MDVRLVALALFVPSAALAAAPPQQMEAQTPPALTGIAASPAGNVFVSPAPGTGDSVLEIDRDGLLVRTWKMPANAIIEVSDGDASGQPVCVDARGGKLYVLGAEKPVREVDLASIKATDVKALAPLVRAGPGGSLYVPALDGTFILAIGEGEPRFLRTGSPFPLTDFDVSSDGRIVFLDSIGGRMRLHGGDGSAAGEVPLSGGGSPSGAFFGLVRYAPNGDLWVLELPSPETQADGSAPRAAFIRLDPKGKRLGRFDRVSGGDLLGPVAGFSAVDDGVWAATLDGGVRRLSKEGKQIGAFDATPAPPGIEWTEKRRLEKVAAGDIGAASVADVVAAMAVTRGRTKGEELFARMRKESAAALPLVTAAVAKGQVDGGLLATLIAAEWPATKDALSTALKDPSPLVRAAAIAVLRASTVEGFDAELAAAAKDADRQVRASALVVIRLARWNDKTSALVVARLYDADVDVAMLASSILAERLPLTVGAVCDVVKDPKASDEVRTIAAKTLLLDVPGGERLDPLPDAKRAPIRALAQSADARVQRIGALALSIHGDAQAPAAIEKAWPKMEVTHKRLAMASWNPALGDAGAEALGRLLAKEKNLDLRPEMLQALARTSGGAARKKLLDLATKPGGDERDRAVAVSFAARKLSDDQIVALASELPSVGAELRRAIIELCALRGVIAAAPKIAKLADASNPDRPDAYVALYRLGTKDGVAPALANIAAGRGAPEVEYAYLAAVGGLPEEARPAFRDLATARGPLASLAAEALARSGDAYGLPAIVAAAKSDRYGAGTRDGAIAGALAALGAEGRTAAIPLLTDGNAATRENAALALALQGGDSCRELSNWGRSPANTTGVSVPTAFFALAACGEINSAHELYRRSIETARKSSEPVYQTAAPETFAALLAKMLRQPDFRPKSDAVLGAVSGLPKPVVQAVGQALSADLHPEVASAAMKHVY